IVPQARKEVRLLNRRLEEAGKQTLAIREVEGADVLTPGQLGSPAGKNAILKLRELFGKDEVDGVFWITSMKGKQDGNGFFELEKLLKAKPGRQLNIRHIWPEQILAGSAWQKDRGHQARDPLHPEGFPTEWLKPVQASSGYVIRAWRAPPADLLDHWGAPDRQLWQETLRMRYGIRFVRARERWYLRPYGLDLVARQTLVPFFSEESRKARDEEVFRELCQRGSIEDDLQQIKGERIGALFAFGFRERDALDEKRSTPDRTAPGIDYVRQIRALTDEFRSHRERHEANPNRVYETVFMQTKRRISNRPSPEEVAQREKFSRAAARMIRDEKLDALYLMTNGFVDERPYGEFSMAYEPLAQFLFDTKTRLYVRVPFEVGIAPYELQQMAVASGGGVFFGPGSEADADFETGPVKGSWPRRE
ncbi:MAG: hypothetical protein HKN23_19610, partial [Verrucomicrobiales bacterium]|nr:hypothetical protein [Verrucomicrobiales bacterium]